MPIPSDIISSWQSSFDTKTALSGFYLWMLFGFLSLSVSCDMQKWVADKIWFRHLVGIIAFFFLFTIIDSNSGRSHVGMIWIKTLLVYFIFLLMTKSKWYFSMPVLIILVIDQTIKSHKSYIESTTPEGETPDVLYLDDIRNIINIILILLISVGFIEYIIRQRKHFGDTFSLSKLLLEYKCKN